jgi:hypothetical protein
MTRSDNLLVGGEGAGLAEQLVHQGGLAVVDVGDDGDVAEGAGHVGNFLVSKAKHCTPAP